MRVPHILEDEVDDSDEIDTKAAQAAFKAWTIPEASHRFLGHCRTSKGLAANTLRSYASDLEDFGRFAGPAIPIAGVDREVIRSFAHHLLEERKVKATTARRRMATLKVLFRWLEKEDAVPISVFHRLDLSIRLPKRLPRALTGEEIRQLLRRAESARKTRARAAQYEALVMHFVVVALFTTGVRISELVSVRRTDVDIRDGAIQVHGKGNRERRVYLPGRQARELLRVFLTERDRRHGPTEALLLTAKGICLSPATVRKQLRTFGGGAGITRRVTPHMLRHTAATQLLEAGVDIRFVQKLLGHASIATTQIYTHVTDRALRMRLNQANTLGRMGRKMTG
ncbi:MAG TPA: tyrosine-type recombinase/integrase [Vicinamibacterales bacterium]|nr:tyrosine-type recombinase/integrase [Vicinamibacterales bacterium]